MLRVLFTLDYEIHGNGEGDPYELMVEPTARMLESFEVFGAKLTIMADIGEILKFKEYREQRGRDDYHYGAIIEQLRESIRRGHDVQLHIHSSYFNARHEAGRWAQDWSEYNFAGLAPARMEQMVRVGKGFLEDLLQPVDSEYRCCAFRAANWSVSPAKNVVRALVANGIKIDSSVFKHGQREGLVTFDYRNAWSELAPWRADDEDLSQANPQGQVFEFPIYCERRWLGAFVTPQRFFRALMSRRHRFSDSGAPSVGRRASLSKAVCRRAGMLAQRHAWKADFNQCSGRQLIRALRRAEARHGKSGEVLPFVLIGHSKLYTRFNQRDLRRLLRYASENRDRFSFGTFRDFECALTGIAKGDVGKVTSECDRAASAV